MRKHIRTREELATTARDIERLRRAQNLHEESERQRKAELLRKNPWLAELKFR